MSSVSLRNIYKIYPNKQGDVTAVSDFNLEIETGEFIILVGPSGCGKSTTLRMVAGLEEISKGDLFIGDRRCNDVQPKDRDIAMVFQNYALYPHMSVYDNMAFGLKLRKMPKDEIDKKVRAAAETLQITSLLERKPKALSGGQRQRVALGRCIVRNPKVFLLDEPLSNLDAKLRSEMRTEITRLHNKLGTTFIYVTHDQTEAMTMGTRIVVMSDGFVQQIDSPKVLYDCPTNLFVAGFIGSPQMNFAEVDVQDDDGVTYLKLGKSTRLALSADKGRRPEVLQYAGKQVIMGIRPESIVDEELERFAGTQMEVVVDVVEPLGSETFLYVTCEGFRFTARVSPRTTVKSGDVIKLALDPARIHLFENDTKEKKAIVH